MNLETSNKISALIAEETYNELKDLGADAVKLMQLHQDLNRVVAVSTVKLGLLFKEARECFPANGGRNSSDGWQTWLELIGWKQQRASELMSVADKFGHLLTAPESGGVEPKFPSKSVLIELSKGKYTPPMREALLESKGPKLSLMDCQLLAQLDVRELHTVDEVIEVIDELNNGLVGGVNNLNLKAAENTFKATNAQASTMRRTAQVYEENKQFAPAPVIEKVEKDMTRAIGDWIKALPPTSLVELQGLIDERLGNNTQPSTALLNITNG